MQKQRRTFLSLMGLAAGVAAFPALASSSNYPNRPIRIVIPFPAASLPDTIMRSIAQRIDLEQTLVIDSRPGGNTFLGMSTVANAEPDGYTVAVSTISTDVVNPMVYSKMPYDPNDLEPLAVLGYSPYVLLVPSEVPAKSLDEVVAMAKAQPGVMNFGSAGTGNSTHIVSEKFLQEADIEMTHIPYSGSSPAHLALMRGDLQFYSDVLTSALPHIQAGRFRPLAVTSETRHPLLPDVPTMVESGFDDFIVTAWYGLQVPRGTPKPIIEKLAKAIDAVLVDPTLIEEYATRGMVISPPGGPEYMTEVIERDRERWGPVIRRLEIRLD